MIPLLLFSLLLVHHYVISLSVMVSLSFMTAYVDQGGGIENMDTKISDLIHVSYIVF